MDDGQSGGEMFAGDCLLVVCRSVRCLCRSARMWAGSRPASVVSCAACRSLWKCAGGCALLSRCQQCANKVAMAGVWVAS
jgi:hypothetical protein